MIPVSILGAQEKNQEACIYIGNLDEKVNEALLWELMIQMGPVKHVNIPRDRVTGQHQGYGFCEFGSELDADYAVKVMNQVRLYGKPLKVNRSAADKRTLDVGANLFVGNLAPQVDEKILYDTFGMFGTIITAPTLARDPGSSASRGFGFVSYDCFEASDAAIEAMHGQYLCNKPISVSYAFKKEGSGERHGSPAERLLAAQAKKGDKGNLQSVQPGTNVSNLMAGMPGYYTQQAQGAGQQQPSPMGGQQAPAPAAPYPSYVSSGGPFVPPPRTRNDS